MSEIVKMRLPLPDGGAILLVEWSHPWEVVPDAEIDQNVYRVDAHGTKLWRIRAAAAVRPRTPFTNIYFSPDGRLMAGRFDCYEHEVNLNTGDAIVVDYLK